MSQQDAKIIRSTLNDSDAKVSEIIGGYDGKKYQVMSRGTVYFCRVKKISTSHIHFDSQEQKILQSVQNEHTVKPIHSVCSEGRHILITPYIEGDNLDDFIKKNGPLPEEECKKLASVLISAIRSIEKAGVIHFDIKPANIIVGKDGYMLVDFGAARFTKGLRGEKIYPPRRYIAPEVLTYLFYKTPERKAELTIRADIYSAGGTLYYALTGKSLGEFFNVSDKILHNQVPPISDFCDRVSQDFASLIYKMLEKKFPDRPSPTYLISALKGTGIEDIRKNFPNFFLKTPQKNREYTQMWFPVSKENRAGVLWVSDVVPPIKPKTSPINIIWEMPFNLFEKDVDRAIRRQWETSVVFLCVPGKELYNPLNTETLDKNIEIIQKVKDLARKHYIDLKILPILTIDDSLLLREPELDPIQGAYLNADVDGLILRIAGNGPQTSLDTRHLEVIKKIIMDWTRDGKMIYFDGDLSVIPLLPYGLSGYIAKTAPKIDTLFHKRVKPRFSRRADRMYVPSLLTMLTPDNVYGLKNSKYKKMVACNCEACKNSLWGKHKGKKIKKENWDRPDRRKHFIYTVVQDIETLKSSPQIVLTRVEQAIGGISQIERYIDISPEDKRQLRNWREFLKNN